MKKYLEWFCGGLAGLALFCIMALTFFDVLSRKLLSRSINGSLELTEILMVVVIFAALPLVTLRSEHVVFDSLDSYLPPALVRLQRPVVQLLCVAAMLGLAVLMWQLGTQFVANGETTAQLKISKAPFIYLMAVLCAVCGAAHLMLARLAPHDASPAEAEGGAL